MLGKLLYGRGRKVFRLMLQTPAADAAAALSPFALLLSSTPANTIGSHKPITRTNTSSTHLNGAKILNNLEFISIKKKEKKGI